MAATLDDVVKQLKQIKKLLAAKMLNEEQAQEVLAKPDYDDN